MSFRAAYLKGVWNNSALWQVHVTLHQIPKCSPSNPIQHSLVPHVHRRTVQKTILLAKLAPQDPNKPSSSRANRLTDTVITSAIVKLDHTLGECNIETVADMVKNQVGFEVISLDSKLYPLIANDSTSGLDYWKSTRKIIDTSRAVFEKIVGKSLVEVIDEDVVIVEPQAKKVRVDPDDTDTLERTVTIPILEKLQCMQKCSELCQSETSVYG